MTFTVLVFLVGFLFGKIHNLWERQQREVEQRDKIEKIYEIERSRMRSSLEDQIIIDLGLGHCHSLREAQQFVEGLKDKAKRSAGSFFAWIPWDGTGKTPPRISFEEYILHNLNKIGD